MLLVSNRLTAQSAYIFCANINVRGFHTQKMTYVGSFVLLLSTGRVLSFIYGYV